MEDTRGRGSDPRVAIVKSYREIAALLPSHWVEGTVVANGIRHHYYRTGGDKPALVLLHGFLEGALSWLRTARALEEDYDVVMFDARGHGRSEGITTGYSQALLTADAAAAIRALGLGRARLLGFSQGGTTGIHLADAHPDLVHSLVVAGWIDDTLRTDVSQSEGYRAWYDAYLAWLEQLKTQTHEERMLSALSQLPPDTPLPPEDEYVPWVETCARLDLDLVQLGTTLWSQVSTQAEDIIHALERVACPVLIMKSGAWPTPGAPQTVEEEASDRPNVRVLRFVNAGHLIYRRQFEPFLAAVKAFFAEQ